MGPPARRRLLLEIWYVGLPSVRSDRTDLGNTGVSWAGIGVASMDENMNTRSLAAVQAKPKSGLDSLELKCSARCEYEGGAAWSVG
jgi:hypothetical protein